MIIVAMKLSDMPTHIPVIPRKVFDSNQDSGTLITHNDKKVKTIVIIVWPAPLITPLATNMIEKKT